MSIETVKFAALLAAALLAAAPARAGEPAHGDHGGEAAARAPGGGHGEGEGHEEHEEHSDTVTVSTRSQALAGIGTARVGGAGVTASFTVNGRVVQDARGLFHVRAGAAGLFRPVVALGQPVQKGSVLGAVESGGARGELLSPAQGAVSGLAAADGAEVRPGEILITVTGSDPVWAVLDVPERELSRLEAGRAVTARSSAWPGRSFEGTVEFVAPEVDEVSRTIKARARLANPGGLLKFGLFVSADIEAAGPSAGLSVPSDALQRLEGEWVVFVRVAPDKFQARRVRPGAERGGRTAVLGGLRAGETIAVKGAFLLKSELMKEAIGGHEH